jgi:hypothetical protein
VRPRQREADIGGKGGVERPSVVGRRPEGLEQIAIALRGRRRQDRVTIGKVAVERAMIDANRLGHRPHGDRLRAFTLQKRQRRGQGRAAHLAMVIAPGPLPHRLS